MAWSWYLKISMATAGIYTRMPKPVIEYATHAEIAAGAVCGPGGVVCRLFFTDSRRLIREAGIVRITLIALLLRQQPIKLWPAAIYPTAAGA